MDDEELYEQEKFDLAEIYRQNYMDALAEVKRLRWKIANMEKFLKENGLEYTEE